MAEQQAMVPPNIVTKTTQVESRAEQNEPNSTAGRISQYIDEWRKITSDPEILDLVTGYAIELTEGPPPCNQSNYAFSLFEQKIIDFEISKLLIKHVIVPSCHEAGEVISPIFICPKKDGSHRMILNLKHLNNYVLDIIILK